jgi:hypothetical protein
LQRAAHSIKGATMDPWNIAALAILPVLGVLLLFVVVAAFVIVPMLRKGSMRQQTPGPLMFAEAWAPFRDGLSLMEKRELASRVDGQRVRWSGTFQEVFGHRGGGITAMLRGGDPARGACGLFYFDPNGADRRHLESLRPGVPLVVEGTVRIDLDHELLTLDAAFLRPDMQPR